MKCVVRMSVPYHYYCVVEARSADEAVQIAVELPDRAWLLPEEIPAEFSIDKERTERLRNWEFPHDKTWRKDRTAVDANGQVVDRELTKRERQAQRNRRKLEALLKKEAA